MKYERSQATPREPHSGPRVRHRARCPPSDFTISSAGSAKPLACRSKCIRTCSGIACGYKLANDGHDTRALQHYLGHKNIQHTVRYTELSPDRFRDFWVNFPLSLSGRELPPARSDVPFCSATPTSSKVTLGRATNPAARSHRRQHCSRAGKRPWGAIRPSGCSNAASTPGSNGTPC
jgi:Phage integrase family